VARRLRHGEPRGGAFRLFQAAAPAAAYRLWRARLMRALAAPAPSGRLISLILDGDAGDAARTVASLAAQDHAAWELLLPAGAPDVPEEPRLRPLAQGAEPADAALGSHVGRIAAGDTLAPGALARIAAALSDDTDLLYTDEERMDGAGRPLAPLLKRAFDPDLAQCRDMIGRLALVRRDLAPLGPLAVALAHPGRVRHLALPLYRRAAIPAVDAEAHRKAVQPLLDAAEPGAVAEVVGGLVRVRWPLPSPVPPVSVIVPTKDRVELLRPCVEAVLDRTQYPALELIVIDHESSDPATCQFLDALRRRPGVRVLPHAGPFDYSAMNNLAAASAAGEVLLFLNNDVEPLGPWWMNELVAQAVRPGVGAVGAKLLYPDRRIQHGGVVLGLGGGVAGHRYRLLPGDAPGPDGDALCAQSPLAVTGACLAVTRAAFEAVGGFDAGVFPVAFNDVDLCLRLRERGLRSVWTPHAVLLHKESASLGRPGSAARRAQFAREEAAFRARWGHLVGRDPSWHPLRSLEGDEGWLAWPPPAAAATR